MRKILERKKRHEAWKRFMAKQDGPESKNPEDYPIAIYSMDMKAYQMDDHPGLWAESTDTGKPLVAAYDGTMRRFGLFRKLTDDEAVKKIESFVELYEFNAAMESMPF